MSKVKYPDKEKIRIQIDEILDKSELFDATEDKSSTYTNDKIVQLKPVKQHLPVGKYISGCSCNSGNCYICYISKELSDSWQRRAEQDKFRAVSNQQFRGRYA